MNVDSWFVAAARTIGDGELAPLRTHRSRRLEPMNRRTFLASLTGAVAIRLRASELAVSEALPQCDEVDDREWDFTAEDFDAFRARTAPVPVR